MALAARGESVQITFGTMDQRSRSGSDSSGAWHWKGRDACAAPAREAVGLSRGVGSHRSFANHGAMRMYASSGGNEAEMDQVMFTFFLNHETGDS